MQNTRSKIVDNLKGYACFLVVFGHIIMGIRKAGITTPSFFVNVEKFIWSFHVALFMFLSGYVYRLTGFWKSKGTRFKFIKYKLLNLGVPYIAFSIIYIVINSVMGSSVNNKFSLSNILDIWRTPVAQYWFLYDLFFLFLAFTILSLLFKTWQITIILFAIKVLLPLLGITVIVPFSSMVNMALFFGIGASVSKLYVDEWNMNVKIAFIIVHLLLSILFITYSLDNQVIIESAWGILGIIASIIFIGIVSRIKFIEKLLLWICKYSFQIYLIHTIFTAGIRIVLIKCSITNYWIQVLAGLIFGFGFPVLTAFITKKTKILDFVFYPSKTIKIITE